MWAPTDKLSILFFLFFGKVVFELNRRKWRKSDRNIWCRGELNCSKVNFKAKCNIRCQPLRKVKARIERITKKIIFRRVSLKNILQNKENQWSWQSLFRMWIFFWRVKEVIKRDYRSIIKDENHLKITIRGSCLLKSNHLTIKLVLISKRFQFKWWHKPKTRLIESISKKRAFFGCLHWREKT